MGGRRNHRLAILIAVTAGQPAAGLAQDAAPLELAASTPWAINYDADSCALQRHFGDAGQRVFLEIRRYGPADTPQLVVASPDLPPGLRDIEASFVPIDGQPVEVDAFTVEMADGYTGRLFSRELLVDNPQADALFAAFVAARPNLQAVQRERLLQARDLSRSYREAQGNAREAARRGYANVVRSEDYRSVPRAFFQDFKRHDGYVELVRQQAGQITGMRVDGGFEQQVLLRTGSLAAPLRAMDACLDELMLHWGIDVEAHRHLSRAVEPLDYDRLAREIVNNYPREMLRQHQQAMVRVRLAVGADGSATGCNLQNDYNETQFEQVVCQNMLEYARFEPALDAAGQPIASYYQVAVTYRLN